jgi:fructose-specific phosphotransferase system IIA component
MRFAQIISADTIIPQLRAETKEELFIEMAAALKKAGRIQDLTGFVNDVKEREKIEVTDLGNGVAIPHTQSSQVLESSICIGCKKEGIPYGEEGEPVRLAVMFAARQGDEENQHLALLSKFARMMVYDEFITEILGARTAQEILDIIRKYEEIAEKDC